MTASTDPVARAHALGDALARMLAAQKDIDSAFDGIEMSNAPAWAASIEKETAAGDAWQTALREVHDLAVDVDVRTLADEVEALRKRVAWNQDVAADAAHEALSGVNTSVSGGDIARAIHAALIAAASGEGVGG